MNTQTEGISMIELFADSLKQLPDEIIDGLLKATEDEDGKIAINSYAVVLKKQFTTISALLLENAGSMSKEKSRNAEELLKVTCGIELTQQVKVFSSNLGSNTSKISLAGLVQMIKKIIKWLVEFIFKKLPSWLNKLIDLIDEILNEVFGIGSPKLANVLSQKEQNYLSELTHLAILNREERYLYDDTEEDDL